jgi:hypothetical protein
MEQRPIYSFAAILKFVPDNKKKIFRYMDFEYYIFCYTVAAFLQSEMTNLNPQKRSDRTMITNICCVMSGAKLRRDKVIVNTCSCPSDILPWVDREPCSNLPTMYRCHILNY